DSLARPVRRRGPVDPGRPGRAPSRRGQEVRCADRGGPVPGGGPRIPHRRSGLVPRGVGRRRLASDPRVVRRSFGEELTGLGERDDTITGGRMVTRELATWVAQVHPGDVPDAVLDEAGRAFTDFLGECLFVGGTKEWGRSIADFCAREGGGQPEATIIATGK